MTSLPSSDVNKKEGMAPVPDDLGSRERARLAGLVRQWFRSSRLLLMNPPERADPSLLPIMVQVTRHLFRFLCSVLRDS